MLGGIRRSLILFFIIGLLAVTVAAHAAANAATYTFKRLDEPGISVTAPTAINASGQVVGSYVDANGNIHGFLYSGGKFGMLDNPNAVETYGSEHGTYPADINANGQVVGTYVAADGVAHGFIATPI